METHFRSILKAGSWRLAALLITMTVAYAITRKTELAAAIGLGDTAIKLGAYYLHERLWLRVKFGLRRPTDYEI